MKKRFLIQGLYSSIFSDASYSFEEDKITFRGLSKEDLFKNIDNYYQKLSLDSNIDKLSFINHMSSIVKSVKSAYDLLDSEIDENIIILTGLNPNTVFVGTQNLYQSLNNNDLLIQSSLQEKNDIIASGQGRDYISTNQGNDVVYANENHDVLIGGQGNDQLYGGSGNDTYIYNKGDGKDVIRNIDPLVADLNGDGVKLTHYNDSKAVFDPYPQSLLGRLGYLISNWSFYPIFKQILLVNRTGSIYCKHLLKSKIKILSYNLKSLAKIMRFSDGMQEKVVV